jgi:hypothetical protein
MTGKKNPEREGLDRLADALIDDILNASDEEILEEFQESDGDPERHAADMLALFEKSVTIANKRRLARAKAGVAADRATANNKGAAVPINIEEVRRQLRAVMNNPNAPEKLTLAARKESELSDADIVSLMEDLFELGALPPDDGNDETA